MLFGHGRSGRLSSRAVLPLRARRDRGVTLIATVLLSVIAATIALVLVRQTVLTARAESVRNDFDVAYSKALSAKIDFERQLSADPNFFYKSVYRYERPRVCAQTSGPLAVLPDPASQVSEPWPSTCGNTWTYIPSGQYAIGTDAAGDQLSWDPAQHPIRMEITPPSASSPNLTVRILAAQGQTETGLTVTYRRSSATEVTAYSQTDLRMDTVYKASSPTASVSVAGTVYSGGKVYLPTSSTNFTGAQLFAEGGFVGATPTSGRLYTTIANGASTDPTSSAPRDIRTVVPAALTMSGLRSGYAQLDTVGCPAGVTPTAVTPGSVTDATTMCLQYLNPVLATTAGATTIDSTNGTTAGAKPAAYLLMYGGTTALPTVSVYTAAVAPTSVGDCTLSCNLRALSQPDYTALHAPESALTATRDATHGWQPLGIGLPMPASGVIETDADTYIGQCPASVAVDAQAAFCPDAVSSATTAQASVTVVAGSPSNPRDIILAGSQGAATGVHVGLVATGSVVVPYYARQSVARCAPGTAFFTSLTSAQQAACGTLSVKASIVAFGYGLKPGQSGLRTVPAVQAPEVTAAPGDDNYGKSFTLTGSLAAPSLSTALSGWESVSLTADPTAVTNPPPSFPGFSASWTQSGSSRLSSFAVCGLANCSAVW